MDDRLDVDLDHRLSRLHLEVRLSVGRETLALVGPSGSGKSTVLRAVAGLVRPDRGRIVHGERALLDTARGIDEPAERRRIGHVPQDGGLFPFLDVAGNVAFGVRADRRARATRAREVLERFGISHLARARPGDLSGGERQRVALARAVASDPEILLLDEPLSALDAVTKAAISAELDRRLHELHLPTILVSHDFADVVGLAHRVAVQQDGHVVQVGTPGELVEAPASPFVASLAGVNYFTGTASRTGGLTAVGAEGWERPLLSTDDAAGPVGVVVYPWEVSLAAHAPEGSALNAVRGSVRRVVMLGNRARVSVEGHPSIVAEVTEDSVRHLALQPGVQVVASWKATTTRLVPLREDATLSPTSASSAGPGASQA
jgi:molybdate transport system ATP-binding protein